MVRHLSESDEMVSIAFEALVEGTKRIAEGAIDHHEVPNVSGYLVSTVKGRLFNFTKNPSWRCVGRVKDSRAIYDCINDGGYDDLADKVRSAAKTPSEMEVIQLIVTGHRPSEVAQLLGKHRQYVNTVVTGIRNRLRAKYDPE
jgi:DNA-binding NarL/FixJ family response regulator